MTRLTYRAVFQVDDHDDVGAAAVRLNRLGPPAVSAAIATALLRLLADWPIPPRPEVGAVSVTAQAADSAPLDPDGPFATPDGQELLASFLTDLLAWDSPRPAQDWDGALPTELHGRAKGLLAGLTDGSAW